MKEDFVNCLIERLKIEFKKQDRNGVYGYTQRHLAFNSNKIEGSTLTPKQTNALFETGLLKTEDTYIRAKDVEEATGHFIMFNEMVKTYDNDLTEELIKQYHFALKSGVFEDVANGYPIGEYKSRANIVANIKTTLPNEVEKEMQSLLSFYKEKKEIDLKELAKFHAKYENIHPFQDGNGRTGRIILYKECLKNNICPFIIEDTEKQEYYDCLNEAQTKENYEPLINLFKKEQEKYYQSIYDLIYEAK